MKTTVIITLDENAKLVDIIQLDGNLRSAISRWTKRCKTLGWTVVVYRGVPQVCPIPFIS